MVVDGRLDERMAERAFEAAGAVRVKNGSAMAWKRLWEATRSAPHLPSAP